MGRHKGRRNRIQSAFRAARGNKVAANPKLHDIEIRMPAGGTLKRRTVYESRANAPLFADGQPSPDDVKQGSLGDCYFLAALSALCRESPKAIKDMFHEHKDGTVSVALFDGTDWVVVRVDKSVPMAASFQEGRGPSAFARDALWVQLLEKALAIHKGSYRDSEGGRGGDGPELLGLDHHDLSLQPNLRGRPWETPNNDKSSADKLSETIFENDADGLAAWLNFRSQHREVLYGFGPTLEELEARLRARGLPAGVIKKVVDHARTNQVLAGERGTGNYDGSALALYDQLEEHLQKGHVIKAGTKPFGDDNPIRDGIAHRHAYELLGVEEIAFGPSSHPGRLLKFITVRNPWGQMGRSYVWGWDGARTREQLHSHTTQGGTGVFKVELSDFVALFKNDMTCICFEDEKAS